MLLKGKNTREEKVRTVAITLHGLLDYDRDDNEEATVELSMFAEVFHELLTLEFASSIYRGIVRETEAMEAIKAAERKRKREEGEAEEEGEEGATKKVKQEGRDAAQAPVSEGQGQEPSKSPESPKVEKKIRTDTKLLLAFRFFDRTGCGYLRTEDLRKIFSSLGMPLSHRMVKDLVASAVEVAVARSPAARTGDDRLYIREITDREVSTPSSGATVPNPIQEGQVTGGGGGEGVKVEEGDKAQGAEGGEDHGMAGGEQDQGQQVQVGELEPTGA